MTRLRGTAERVTLTNWQDLGEKFFADGVRARFGTRDEQRRVELLGIGFPKRRTEPFNITDSIERLSQVEGQEDIKERYAALCDFVHHHTGSMAATHASVQHKGTGRIGKGGIQTPGNTLFVRFTDPARLERILGKEFERNASWLLRDARLQATGSGRCHRGHSRRP